MIALFQAVTGTGPQRPKCSYYLRKGYGDKPTTKTDGKGNYFVINEYKAQTESKYGVHCYASPNDYDIWPDERAYMPFNSDWFQAQEAGPYWLLVPGKEDLQRIS